MPQSQGGLNLALCYVCFVLLHHLNVDAADRVLAPVAIGVEQAPLGHLDGDVGLGVGVVTPEASHLFQDTHHLERLAIDAHTQTDRVFTVKQVGGQF